MNTKYILLILLISSLSGCFTDTTDSLSTFTIQLPVYFSSDYVNRTVPDTGRDFTNLFKYDSYKNNYDRIESAEVFQFNYRIDSLVMLDGRVFNPTTDHLVFDYIRYKLQFALPKNGNIYSLDSSDFAPDTNLPIYFLGEYTDVDIAEYFRRSDHILEVPSATADAIAKAMKETPYFYILTEYSEATSGGLRVTTFKYIQPKLDFVIRLKVKL